MTLIATAGGMLIALVVGLIMACIEVLRIPVLVWVVRGGLVVFRNTPLLAQLFFLFYVLPQYGILLDALTVGIIGLSIQYSCYIAEAYRGGFRAVATGQWEAARVLNLPTRVTVTRVILPQAIRPVIPALGNNLISMFKDSSVLSAITVLELLGMTRNLASLSFQYTTLFTAMGIMYLAISLPASFLVRGVEKRLARRRRIA